MTNSGTTPLVSVIMNAYYSEEFLAEAIASVVAQTYSNWEIILWENQSSDGTREIAESFNDPRIHYFFAPDKVSLYESRMNALHGCQGDLVAFLDCDDTWMLEKLEIQIKVFRDPSCMVSTTDFIIKNESQHSSIFHRRQVRCETYRKPVFNVVEAITNYSVGMSTVMIRASAARESLPKFPPQFFMIEDVDIVTRIMTDGILVPVRRALTSYRVHGDNYSTQTDPYGNEWETWVSNLDELVISESDKKALTAWGESQILNSRYRTAVLMGNRIVALRQCFRMSRSISRGKRLLVLALPLKVTQKIVR